VCKKSIKNSQPFVKKMKNVRTRQGGGVTHTVHLNQTIGLRTSVSFFHLLAISIGLVITWNQNK